MTRPQAANSTAEQENQLTTIADLQGGNGMSLPEVEVDQIVAIADPRETADRVVIRMNTTLEDFTYGNPNMHYKLEAGKRYEVPRHIAQYLNGLGYVWH